MKRGMGVLAVFLCSVSMSFPSFAAGAVIRKNVTSSIVKTENRDSGTWQQEEDGWKYLLKDGTNKSGGWLKIRDKWYYFNADGYLLKGWQIIDGVNYYFYPDGSDGNTEGAMAAATTVEGCEIDPDGKCVHPYPQAAAVLNEVGRDLQAAYDYVKVFPYYRMYESPDNGLKWFADFGYTNHAANCYVYAAMLCEMAREMGYEAHLMAGYVPSRTRGTADHGWCEITVDGVTRVYDPDFEVETGKNGFGIWYGESGTWMYHDYRRID